MSSVPVSPIGPEAAPDPRGSVRVQATVTGQWAISTLVTGWSDDEKRALLAGDQEAKDALQAEALSRTCNLPDDVEFESHSISFENRREEATSVR